MALKDLQSQIDHLTILSILPGETVANFSNLVNVNRFDNDAAHIQTVNQIVSLESDVRK